MPKSRNSYNLCFVFFHSARSNAESDHYSKTLCFSDFKSYISAHKLYALPFLYRLTLCFILKLDESKEIK